MIGRGSQLLLPRAGFKTASNLTNYLPVSVISAGPSLQCVLGTINIPTNLKLDKLGLKKLEDIAMTFATQRNRSLSRRSLTARVIMKEKTAGEQTVEGINAIKVISSKPVGCRAASFEIRAASIETRIAELEASQNKRDGRDAAHNIIHGIQNISASLKVHMRPGLTIGATAALVGGKGLRDTSAHFMGKNSKNPAERAYRETVGMQMMREMMKPEYANVIKLAQDEFVEEAPDVTEAMTACIVALPVSIRKHTAAATEAQRDDFARTKSRTVRELNHYFRRLLNVMRLDSVEDLPPL